MSFITTKKIIAGKITLFLFPLLLQAQSPEEYYRAKFNSYFSKDPEVKNFVAIDDKGISIYADATAKLKGEKPKMRLRWKEVDSLKNCRNQATHLKGMKIAIDPGHIGGTYVMATVESRCMNLSLHEGEKDSSHILLEEGNLTFLTAALLKKKLETQGAVVMLTRPDTGISSLGISYREWKRKIKNKAYTDSLFNAGLITAKEVNLLHGSLPDKALFSEVFGPMDLLERTRKINAFQPDLTIIIHYNVNENNMGWTHTTDKDYVMAFVGGCITAKDLKTEAGRKNLLRLLVSDDIENSIKLSSLVVNTISKDLDVPVAKKNDATYLSEHCLSTPAAGVYSRDLALTRLIRGTLVYAEPLYQDNTSECVLLTGYGEAMDGGSPVPHRIEMVVNAYYDAIEEYVEGKYEK